MTTKNKLKKTKISGSLEKSNRLYVVGGKDEYVIKYRPTFKSQTINILLKALDKERSHLN